MTLLQIEGLSVDYAGAHGKRVRVVSDVHLSIEQGESVGLVGESGCGKTTLANAVVGLVPPAAGTIYFRGKEVSGLRGKELHAFRRGIQMVFQDPFGSLNPRMTVGAALEEVLKVHGLACSAAERSQVASKLMERVGLRGEYVSRYPHEFSGGQRQRIGIARALAVNPSLLLADEPVSALDVSVQVQILNLMRELQEELGVACLLIAHDLAVVHYMCSRILVMYLGQIVESGSSHEVFASPAHPYTEALLSAVPDVERGLMAKSERRKRIVLQGDVPSPGVEVSGCPFHPRCHRATERCKRVMPEALLVAEGHLSACHYAGALFRESLQVASDS